MGTRRLKPGTIVDQRFEVLGFVGAGGFAMVYKANQAKLDREVALKILTLTGDDDEQQSFEDRFLREAKLAAQIDHPNVVTIFDFGIDEENDRQPYIAMELLQGVSLAEELKDEGPIEPKRAIKLFRGALEALGEGHKLGIIHKDLKPANLFLSHPNQERESLRILDFGVARLVEVPDASSLTNTGQIMGTPKYLPPEYIRSQTATYALDVYQMALILVEMMTGAAVVGDTSPFQCLMVHANGDLKIPRSLLTGPLGPVLDKGLAMDHEARYRDASEMLAALRDLDVDKIVVDPDQGDVTLAMWADELSTGLVDQPTPEEVEFGSKPTEAMEPVSAPMDLGTEPADDPIVAPPANRGLMMAALALAMAVIAVLVFIVVGGSGEESDANAGTTAEKAESEADSETTKSSETTESTAGAEPSPDAPSESETPSETPETSETGDAPPAETADDASPEESGDTAEGTPEPTPEPTSFAVVINSTPQGAEVSLAGEKIGTTPFTADLPAGPAVKLQLALAGHAPAEIELTPAAGVEVTETLAPLVVEKKKVIKKRDKKRDKKTDKKDDTKTDDSGSGGGLLIAD